MKLQLVMLYRISLQLFKVSHAEETGRSNQKLNFKLKCSLYEREKEEKRDVHYEVCRRS